MNLADGVLHDVTLDRLLEGFVEEDGGVLSVFVQYQVKGGGSVAIIAFLPSLQGVSPEVPEFWGAGCDLEPVVADEEEVVGALP